MIFYYSLPLVYIFYVMKFLSFRKNNRNSFTVIFHTKASHLKIIKLGILWNIFSLPPSIHPSISFQLYSICHSICSLILFINIYEWGIFFFHFDDFISKIFALGKYFFSNFFKFHKFLEICISVTIKFVHLFSLLCS
jgi:hypothetical protein